MKTIFAIAFLLCTTHIFAQWTQLSGNTLGDFTDLHFFNAQTGFVSHLGELLKTTDGGNTWNSAGSQGFIALSFYDNSNGYGASIVSMSMAKTTNGGSTWTSLTPPSSNSLWAVTATDANTAYFGGTGGVLWKTSNGGASFSVLNSGTTTLITDIHFTSSSTGYLVADDVVRKTTNAGLTWTAALNEPGFFPAKMSWPNASTGYVAGANGLIRKTTDAGQTWVPLNLNTTQSLEGVDFFDADHGIVVGGGGEIWYTSNGGSTWITQNSGTTADLTDVWMFSPSSAIVIGSSGTILKNDNIVTGLNEPLDLIEVELYPNPFENVLSLSSSVPILSIEIYDLLGTQTFRAANLGKDELIIDVSTIPEGVYFGVIHTDKGIITRRIVKN